MSKHIDDISITDIDPNNLDVDWDNQPKLTLHYCQMLADAWKALNEAKAEQVISSSELKRVYARMYIAVKANPKRYHLKGTTKDEVHSAVLSSKRYISKQDECFDWERAIASLNHDVDMLKAAVKAIDDRKAALENRVRLHGQGYFSKPLVKGLKEETIRDIRKRRTRGRK